MKPYAGSEPAYFQLQPLRIPEKNAIIYSNDFFRRKRMKKLLKFMKGYGKECILGPLFKLLEASFELMIPLVVAAIVATGLSGGDRG